MKVHTRANRPAGICLQELLKGRLVRAHRHVLTGQCAAVPGENQPSDGVSILGLAPQTRRHKSDHVIRVDSQGGRIQVHVLPAQLEEGGG